MGNKLYYIEKKGAYMVKKNIPLTLVCVY